MWGCALAPWTVVEKVRKLKEEKCDLGNNEVAPSWASRLWGPLIFLLPGWWGLVPSAGVRSPHTVTKEEQEEEGRWIPPGAVGEGAGQGGKAC